MSIFKSRKQSKEAKKRMEHLMYMAKENPEKIYDLSACELRNVPSSVFAMCKVLQKESLLLHSNLLKNLKTGGSFEDLTTLRILDLHGNKLITLPEEICILKNLQIFNVANNALTYLPDKFGDLVSLQTLNARDNKLTCLPASIEGARSLRTLDISGTNKVFYLVKSLCKVRTLEVLTLTHPSVMEYPPPHVAEQGLEEIMKFMCKDYGIEYIPPSHNLLPVLGNQNSTANDGPTSLPGEDFENSIIAYERLKEEKRKQQLELERQLAESQMEEARLAVDSLEKKAKDLEEISRKQEEFDRSLQQQQARQERERQRMVRMLEDAEKNASCLVDRLLEMNEKARKQEELLEELEMQRLKEEEYFKVTQEDLENLRKKEMLIAMQSMLMENDQYAVRVQEYLAEQAHTAKRVQQSLLEEDRNVGKMILQQQVSQDKLIGQIMMEEDMQRQAFLALQYEKDAARQRIMKQIQEVETALAELSLVEMKRNDYKMGNEQEILRMKREELTDLLITFLKEKDVREEMLKERLVELEEQRENDQIDFWLVQYQRLMDSKPEKLITRETEMDVALLKLLTKAEAEDHVPSFARHKVCTIADLIELSDEDLRRIGVFQVAVRKNILRLIEEEVCKSKKLDDYESSAPVDDQPGVPDEPTTSSQLDDPQPDAELSAENECTVCMEKQSNVIFLPCGHVCTCKDCSPKLQKCPMCRTDIAQKIQIFRN